MRPAIAVVVGLAIVATYCATLADFEHARWVSICMVIMAMIIMVEAPGPGAGCGQQAGDLAGLKFVPRPKKLKNEDAIPPPPLDEGGNLLAGHAYCIVFFTTNSGCVLKLPKAHKLAKGVNAAAGTWFHTVLVSRSPWDELVSHTQRWTDCATPIAHDACDAAFNNYLGRFNTYSVPQAFIVDTKGTILWHGHINRKGFNTTCSNLIRSHKSISDDNESDKLTRGKISVKKTI